MKRIQKIGIGMIGAGSALMATGIGMKIHADKEQSKVVPYYIAAKQLYNEVSDRWKPINNMLVDTGILELLQLSLDINLAMMAIHTMVPSNLDKIECDLKHNRCDAKTALEYLEPIIAALSDMITRFDELETLVKNLPSEE